MSKIDEFLLNPQVRTCSVAVPGTSRNSNLENQGTNEDRPSDDPGPEVALSPPHFGAETVPHMMRGATDPHNVTHKTPPSFAEFIKENCRIATHQTQFRHEKYNMKLCIFSESIR